VIGAEALIRWAHPARGLVGPAAFIPAAESTGLIIEVGRWVVDEACRQFAEWRDEGIALRGVNVNASARQLREPGFAQTIDAVCAQAAAWRRTHGPDALRSIAVNVSARQLLDPALPDVLVGALARHGVPPEQLTIEITETAVFGGGRALATVQALAELGVSIALDDFGTGHSSLGLLRTCPVDVIKVDKSFVDGLGGPPQQEAIVTALTGIARTMGLRTVAEGVETAEQAQRLYELGYRYVQGFHFARPLPAAAIDTLLREAAVAAA